MAIRTIESVEISNPAHLREPLGSLSFDRSAIFEITQRIHELRGHRIWDGHNFIFEDYQEHNELIYARSLARRKQDEILRNRREGGVKNGIRK